MESKEKETCESLFKLDLKIKTTTFKLEVPIKLPYDVRKISEFTQLIISSFNLPIFFEDEIQSKLLEFVKKENFDYTVRLTKTKLANKEAILKEWEQAFCQETLQYNPPEEVGDDEVFAEAYHALVHSPMVGTLLRKESALNSSIKEMHRLKNEEILKLNEKQNLEMSNAISALSLNSNTTDVNRLATLHFDAAHMVRTRWQSLIENENCKQKRDYRNWVVRNYEDYYIEAEETKEKGLKKKHSVRFDETLMISYGDEERSDSSGEPILQESFTIHLGSQMKQMYNIRLFASHSIDFLRFRSQNSSQISPQRLQTAISLYSNDLSGLVLINEQNTSIYNGILKDVSELCQQTTEFHFDSFEKQIEAAPENLKPGDFFVTKHSNLNGAQVIFHLVASHQQLNKAKVEINSRDPVILGLRNILKTACLNDITTITIPALLCNELTDKDIMTVQWCNRRAELVYKCVKGFMIEMASWGGAEMKNLQFIAPKDVSEEIFNGLSAMLPNIFRVSNPLRLSTSSSTHSLQHQSSMS